MSETFIKLTVDNEKEKRRDAMLNYFFQFSLFNKVLFLEALPEYLRKHLIPDYQLGERLVRIDRYPFYNLVPIRTNF